MNGYEIMAASYRQMVKQGRIDKETQEAQRGEKALKA